MASVINTNVGGRQHELLVSSKAVGMIGDEPTAPQASCSSLSLHLLSFPTPKLLLGTICLPHQDSFPSSFWHPYQVRVQRLWAKGLHHCPRWPSSFLPVGVLPKPVPSPCCAIILPLLCPPCPWSFSLPHPPQPPDLIKPPMGCTYPVGAPADPLRTERQMSALPILFHSFSFPSVSVLYFELTFTELSLRWAPLYLLYTLITAALGHHHLLETEKLRHSYVQWLACGHTANK